MKQVMKRVVSAIRGAFGRKAEVLPMPTRAEHMEKQKAKTDNRSRHTITSKHYGSKRGQGRGCFRPAGSADPTKGLC
jgi:hypothetical protein